MSSAGSDTSISLIVTDREGTQQSLVVHLGDPLMFALRDADLGIEASCGGGAVCATCHIFIEEDWQDLIPPPDVFEQMQLDGLVHANDLSRLACQITVCTGLANKKLTIAPEEL